MQEKYYILDPNGGKIGPADIVELTRWARDGRLLPENTICDEYGNTCNARDIISFMKITEKPPKNVNTTPFYIIIFILAFVSCVCVMGYVGLRANYNKLTQDHVKLKQEYSNLETTISELEKRNEVTQREATEFIGEIVKKYNLMEKEKETLTDQLGSLQEENKTLKNIREAIGKLQDESSVGVEEPKEN